MESEPFAADSSGVVQTIAVAAPLEWDDIARWYAGLARGRYEVTTDLEARLASRLAEAASREDSLRVAHRWVAQDVRYVSLALGLGGYQPRSAAEVAASAAGDCKDKTTLFVALARRLGYEAWPVVVNTRGSVDPELPSITQFDHMVAALRVGDRWLYPDLTVPVVPLDEIYRGLQGEYGVLLRDDGTARIVEFPEMTAEENVSRIRITGTLDSTGAFDGRYEEEVRGALQYAFRAEFAGPLTARQREGVERGVAGRVFESARGDSLVVTDGLDLETPPRLVARITAANVLRPVPGGRLLPLRLPAYADPQQIDFLTTRRPRRFPIDSERVFGSRTHVTELRFELPEGWHAELPQDVRAESAFGTYESRYQQEGRDLMIERRIQGKAGILPPEAVDELIAWYRAIVADDVDYVVIKTGEP